MSTPPRRLTQPLIVKIYELIKPRLRKTASGLWEYDHEWSDARVSDILKADRVTPNNVAQVRGKLFGNIAASKSGGATKTKLEEVNAQLTDHMAAMTAYLIRLEAKVDHLTKEMGARPWEPRPLNGVAAPSKDLTQER